MQGRMKGVAFVIVCVVGAASSSARQEGEQDITHFSTTPGIYDIEVEWEGRRTSQSLEERMQVIEELGPKESAESNDRRLQTKSKNRQVFVRNRCNEPVDATVAYYRKPTLQEDLVTRHVLLPVGQEEPVRITKKLKGNSFFVMGSSSSFVWSVPTGNLCLEDSRCFEEVRAKKRKSKVTFSFTCEADDDSGGDGGFLNVISDIPTASPETPTASPETPTASPETPTASPVVSVQLTARQQEWLDSHNVRRRKYHAQFGKSFVPLKWSTELATSALRYGERLIGGFPNCHIMHGFQGDSYGGENLALNKGTSNVVRSPDSINQRWTEDEEFLPFFENGHFSQVIWRGSNFVGCADVYKFVASDPLPHCHIQVCRYLAPGNCNIGEETLFEKMVEDFSPCPPQCPADQPC